MVITNPFKQKKSLFIILIYNLVNIICELIFFPLMPLILNYSPGIVEKGYLKKWLGVSYSEQYFIVILLIFIAGTILLYYLLKDIRKWELIDDKTKIDNEWQLKISKQCISIPYMIYFFQLIIPITMICITYFLVGIFNNQQPPMFFIFGTSILIFSFEALNATFMLIVSKHLFQNILLEINNKDVVFGFRFNIKNKILIFALPLFVGAILFTSKIQNSMLIIEKGDYIYQLVKHQLVIKTQYINQNHISSENILEILQTINVNKIHCTGFVLPPNNVLKTSDGSQLNFSFKKYLKEISITSEDRVYELTRDIQGVIVKIPTQNGKWIAGVKYTLISREELLQMLINFISLFIVSITALYLFSKALAGDMASIANSLTQIAKGKNINLNEKLAVTSNDEIGDLVVAFNKIQELEKEHIRKIEENQAILIERERLASLGHLIGGIAHNLKTPIMSISGGTEALKDLIKEYCESVDDSNVTIEDHIEISQEMQKWVDSIKTHCAYMSEIISAVREQAVQMNYSENQNFTVEDLVKRVETLLKYELKKNHCPLQIDIRVPHETVIQGEETNLVQVLNNLIVNAIQSYGPKGGPIDLIVEEAPYGLEFILQDHGKGIPNKIKDRLFKEMVTTKGKQGTGLGLYMSYLTIKGKFGGNMWFESAEDQGTSFHIAIPL